VVCVEEWREKKKEGRTVEVVEARKRGYQGERGS